MEDDCKYPDIFSNEDFVQRRLSTFEDVQVCISLLKEVLEYRKKNISSWIVESKVKQLCSFYKCLIKNHRNEFIQVLSKDYAVNHYKVFQLSETLAKCSNISESDAKSDAKILKNEDQLRTILTPQYSWLFLNIGKLEKGVKFLVDLRTDVLELIAEKNSEVDSTVELQQLNSTLRDLLSLWFSIGFLQLQRVTWNSPCEMLQKISEYEAVHPVRSWTDLKRRVGPYRRCFVFLHGSMPGEPIVVLHTALCDEIASSMSGIEEDATCVKAAVFYSISSTQKGLQGIELGNYLIKSVVHELQIEFPQMTQFSSLSPIPNFKTWLIDKVKFAEKGSNDILLHDEIITLKKHLNSSSDFWKDFKKILLSNAWAEDKNLVSLLEKPLMRLCARYLFIEKRRGYAFDSVANFHLKNGAVLWRLNWSADLSPRGLGNSCSMMVNYRYFLEDTESNSRAYLENFSIPASEQILNLAEQAKQKIVCNSDSWKYL
ncbi:malonyl-CoA decarboxylase, putative [Pediculus humanus corporis]|uniref:Malonyl-CoA decarboxylase, putative n=1 Tax=Pediculus humanus subsp. corporis TaxID=121224 RepID=E0VWE9_PEDHC|nr:malonyl-CoA decarboxylase, putative [Pediculus humanus corporis]EEB17700.1 malonyl-CoA decarboxylase, putative [Pediculus humanus corporis]